MTQPTMEEIAGWLREEGRRIFSYWLEAAGDEFAAKKSTLWFERAAQVEAMTIIKTCETCINFDEQSNDCLSSFDSSFENGADIEHCGTKFGCIHHKDKPQPPVKK